MDDEVHIRAQRDAVPPRLPQINLVVTDVPRSVAFYQRLGVRFEEMGHPAWALHHANGVTPDGLRLELDSVAFAQTWNPGLDPERLGASVLLFFEVPQRGDVDRLHAELVAAGHASQKEPEDAFWGARYAIVSDPDGHGVGISSPVDASMRRPPPAPPGDGS